MKEGQNSNKVDAAANMDITDFDLSQDDPFALNTAERRNLVNQMLQ